MTNSSSLWSRLASRAAIAIAALSLSDNAQAQSAPQNRAIVAASFDAWKAGTGNPFDLLTDNASWTIEGHSVASKTYPNKEAFMVEVIWPFNARMSVGIKPTVKSITAEADRVVIHFDAAGMAKDGKPYRNTYAWFFQMKDGRVIRASAFFDSISFNELWARVAPTE